jgi:hypothetical protein
MGIVYLYIIISALYLIFDREVTKPKKRPRGLVVNFAIVVSVVVEGELLINKSIRRLFKLLVNLYSKRKKLILRPFLSTTRPTY